MATVFEFAGWAAETEFENHAVVNSEDMSVVPCLFIDDEIIDALPLARFRQQRFLVSSRRSFLQPRQDVGRTFFGLFSALSAWNRESACLQAPFVAGSSSSMLCMFGKVSLQRMKVKSMFPS